ncbi:MAG: alanine--tRNA ligase [Chthoniobacterales bacterium]|nr:alanine--tRNA ligase [Chthoniobacterales bacterium]
MTSTEIRQSFLDFFREKQHTIVPSSSLLPDSPNLLFTNAGMNQFVPIFLGQETAPYRPPRAADAQKCIRAGGKHNDLDEVGLDTYHHTFFEMLGNWSFGDYFKKEAIEWAWELVVRRWGLPPERLYATVYRPGPNEPSQFDEEAHDHWKALFEKAGLDPAMHVVNGSKADNFWMMGDTGPCGPCSELHVDLTPAGDTRGSLVNAGDARCIEIWNLVFIQFNANPDGTFVPLPARHVDTGMGFERVTAILQGTKNFTDFSGKISNYETDIFRPIFDEIEKLSGKTYGGTLPDVARASSLRDSETPKLEARATPEQIATDIAFRVIADHIRTLSFAIADGIQPGNTDRNYVLRRILRRAVRYGRSLGFKEPFFYKLVAVLARTVGEVFPEVRAKQKHVEEVLKREEEAFNRTLDAGMEILSGFFFDAVTKSLLSEDWNLLQMIDAVGRHELSDARASDQNWPAVVAVAKARNPDWTPACVPPISGKDAFKLYDTYGFPLDLTELIARERGLAVDTSGFEKYMEEQRARARAAQKTQVIALADTGVMNSPSTHFIGYDWLSIGQTKVLGTDGKWLITAESPFFPDMGGQIWDTGWVVEGARMFEVKSVHKVGNGVFVHWSEEDFDLKAGDTVQMRVDPVRRAAIQRHHTVTHLLHWALHEVVSKEATQKGSFVGPDKLTFDFNSAALTPAQVRDIERLVNERIVENSGVSWTEVPYADVRGRADIMQFFGDKYGETVRVVQIGGAPTQLDGYSMELCAGTHTRDTGEIGLFRINSEAAIAAGVRRIEAVAGLHAYDLATADTQRLHALSTTLNTPVSDLEKRVESLLAQQKEREKEFESVLKHQAHDVVKNGLKDVDEAASVPNWIAKLPLDDYGVILLPNVLDALKVRQFRGVAVLGGVANGSVQLGAFVSPDFTARFQAGRLIQQIAPVVGGKGGGRPDNARGAGKDATKLDEALAKARSLLFG